MKVPKLRFKNDDGREFPEWEEGLLDDAFEYRNGKSLENEISDSGQFFLITLNSIDISGKLKADHKRVSRTDFSLIKNDLVMILSDVAHGNFLGLTDIIPSDKYVLNQRIGGLRAKIHIDVRFASSYINYNQKYFKLHGQGSSQQNLSKGDVLNFSFPLPHIHEQTKIANFLTAIDEKITQLTQKCDLLTQYKKGVMQQIFSQKLRFKDDDGREFPEWEKRKLGDIAVFYNGRAYKQSEWETTGLPVIRLQNLTGSSTDYYYSNLKLPEKQYCNNGDLLFMWSATFGPVWWNGDKAIYHYHIWKIETDSSTLSKNFLFYVLDEITEKTKNTSNGSTMLHVTKESIEKLVINLPSLSEQTKIANFLTVIDGKITQAQTQLDAVKRYKKGLLQQMFV